MTADRTRLETLCINTIRTLSMDAIQKANSGHPGAPMGLAPAGYVLWTQIMKHNPKNPAWTDRDRFVLSGGHASMLIYSLLHLTGYSLSLDDIKEFRQLGSKTPGHPEFGHTAGVETTTGPLGQGFANAVGMAMAEAHLDARFNKADHTIVDHYTYVMCGDGDLMEGVSAEAASIAGHLGLGKLICIYDDNHISIEGETDIAFTEDVAARFSSYGWQVITVHDGNDTAAIKKAILDGKAEAGKPTLIKLRTNIAFGSPNKQDTSDAHGAPLGDDEIKLTKENLGWPSLEPFFIPEEALTEFRSCIEAGEAQEAKWQESFSAYTKAHPDMAHQWLDAITGFLPDHWDENLPEFKAEDGAVATRNASGKVLNALAEKLPTLIGGSADLAPSNKTFLNGLDEFQKGQFGGRNIRFGVREHAMASIMNGMFLHAGVRPFGGTFLVFSDYMRPAMRVASLMNIPVIYVLTHDSVAVGEDGPTHQPVEHVASLRIIPNLTVIRPADANETRDAWIAALASTSSPTALILSRQGLPIIDQSKASDSLKKGAYLLNNPEGTPDITLVASGSEVHLIVEAEKRLADKGFKARVVSMPSWELFEAQPDYYQDWVFPKDEIPRLAVEAGHTIGWEKYVGRKGRILGINEFGASGPGKAVLEQFGFSVDRVVEEAMLLLKPEE